MAVVQALQSFEHNGPRKRGARFHASDSAAIRLRDAGLVTIVGEQKQEASKLHPHKPAGNPSFASPAGPASQNEMSNVSGSGEKKPRRKKREVSSL